ncbi:Gfo/Idh/MocA family protein [Oceanispirochaeta sp. M1]|uniref:Gfo/Idh/MocA family protein n=2 Tax=Oceanispirochaeta TaxID=2035349 RepID=UPI001495347A|nr:Gfo/Idh/MocA family oxidoreductase [Oceanispirochaeta sp. M1]
MEKIVIAMAGFGGIGRIHQLAWSDISYIYPGQLPDIFIKGVCRSTVAGAEETASKAGFEKAYRDYDELLADPEVDIVDLVTPNSLHKSQIMKALKAGKHVLCEKPLALNAGEARELEQAAVESDRQIGMVFNYRFIPAIMKAKELMEQGRIGEIYSFRGEYFHTGYQNPSRPFSWRMDFEKSGGGALADLGSHVIDLLRFLLGDFSSVKADMKTYIKERPLADGSGKRESVTVDDAAWLQCELDSGAQGTIEVSRFATGTLDNLNITVYGSRGSFSFKLMDPNFLYYFDEDNKGMGWNRLETLQHYPDAKIPAPRSVIGWTRFHTENQYRFLKSIVEGKSFSPSLSDGAAVQYVMDAAYRSAAEGQRFSVSS